ncbi:MAG TPA: AI-2E family transporter [Proteobacteria bacterium]|nr:AI-2E family transporter [Pseudomonadota bacterium]
MLEKLELSSRQRATVAAALTLGAALVLLLFFSAIIWGLAMFVGTFSKVLLPPVVAGVLTMLLRPCYNLLIRICRGSQTAALVLFFIAALLPLTLFIWFAGVFVADQLLLLLDDLPSMIQAMREAGRSYWPQFAALLEKYAVIAKVGSLFDNPGEMAARVLHFSGERLSESLLQMFQSVAGWFAWAVLPVYLAFFLRARPFESRRVGDFLPFLKAGTREDVIYLLDEFIGILLTFFRGQIIIALAQGGLFAIGFVLVGLPYGVMIGMGLGLLNIIPYLGSIAGLGVALPLAYFGVGGSLVRLLLVLVVFVVVQVIEGYFLTPRIMGDRTGLHPALIIFAVFFWGVALGGIMGMMLAIPLTAFAVVFWRLLKKKYITEVV